MNESQLGIWNKALALSGTAAINSVTATSPPARACQLFWPVLREAVFRAAPWHCIAKRVSLTEQADTPAWGYAYAYVLPDDYVRMIGMQDPSSAYQDVGGLLHTDESPANIEYVYNCTDCTRYSADLVRSLYLNLGYEVGFCLGRDAQIITAIKTDLEKFFLPLVRFTNSVEVGQKTLQSDTLIDMFA